jgi:cyclic-di-GMP-binding protein
MPSFDITSKVDMHEINNAIDQTNREIGTRFDFKGSKAKVEFKDDKIAMIADNTFQLQQMLVILELKLAKRKVDTRCLKIDKPQESLSEAKQTIEIQQGINQEVAKKITKFIKDSKLKVQGNIQGDQVRVMGKKRDDLQDAIALLREQELGIPLQYENFRD